MSTRRQSNKNQIIQSSSSSDIPSLWHQNYHQYQPSSSKPTKNSHFHRPKSKWVPRNTKDIGAKSSPANKPEVGSFSSCQQDQEKVENCVGVDCCDQEFVKDGEEVEKDNGLECNDDLDVKMIQGNDFFFDKRDSDDDIVSRFENLRVDKREVELSQESFSINDQLQQDEVTAASFTIPILYICICVFVSVYTCVANFF